MGFYILALAWVAVAYPFCRQCEKPDKRIGKIQSSRFLHINLKVSRGLGTRKAFSMKTKKYSNLLMVLFISILGITFTACSSNDDDTPKITSPIVGVWQTTYYTTATGGNLSLIDDGTYYIALKSNYSTSKYKGTYEVSSGTDGIIKLYNEDGSVLGFGEFKISSDNNTMTLKLFRTTTKWKRM